MLVSKRLLGMQETWAVYEEHAYGHDELAPLSLQGVDPGGGLGLMILDNLDTLYIMDLQHEFERHAAGSHCRSNQVLEAREHLTRFKSCKMCEGSADAITL